MTTQLQDLCQMCDNPSTQECTICDAVKYCSQECQALDRDVHNILCPVFSESQHLRARPSKDHYKAVLSPADVATPKIVWLYAAEKVNEAGIKSRYIKLAPYLKSDQSSFFAVYPEARNSWFRCDLPSSNDEKAEDNFCLDQIDWILDGKESTWKGPVLGYVVEGDVNDDDEGDGDPEGPLRDIGVNDFRNMLDSLIPAREDTPDRVGGVDGVDEIDKIWRRSFVTAKQAPNHCSLKSQVSSCANVSSN